MKKFLLFLTLSIGVQLTAHDPNLSTFTLYKEQGQWVLKADFATLCWDLTIRGLMGDVSEMSEQEYKQEAVNYLKENIELIADGKELELGGGGIKMDSHSSILILTLVEFPLSWEELSCRLTCFSEDKEHQNLLRVKMADQVYKEFLKEENSFSKVFFRRIDEASSSFR